MEKVLGVIYFRSLVSSTRMDRCDNVADVGSLKDRAVKTIIFGEWTIQVCDSL